MSVINIIQIILALLLVALILIQQRGAGLGSVLGGDGGVYRTKRGAEKIIHIGTIITAIIFLVVTVINVFLSK